METATGITYETFRTMPSAGRRPQTRTLRSVDQGLGWVAGSAARVIAGGEAAADPAWQGTPAGETDQVRAALRSLALSPRDLEDARGRYDCGTTWAREIAAAMHRVLRDDIDDGVRRILLTAASRSVARVLAVQRAEADDFRSLLESAGVSDQVIDLTFPLGIPAAEKSLM